MLDSISIDLIQFFYGIINDTYISDGAHIGIAHFVFQTVTMYIVKKKVLILLLVFASFSLSGVFTSFHYGSDIINNPLRDAGSNNEDYLQNPKLRVGKRYYSEFSMNTSESVFLRRGKRDESTFIGHPKTREERWHTSFNLNRTNLQQDQAQSLVNLLIKVMDKYLNSCIPIIFYDRYVQASEGIILQKFFKVRAFLFICRTLLWKSPTCQSNPVEIIIS